MIFWRVFCLCAAPSRSSATIGAKIYVRNRNESMWSQGCSSETIDTKRSAGFFDLLAWCRVIAMSSQILSFVTAYTCIVWYTRNRSENTKMMNAMMSSAVAKQYLNVSLSCKAIWDMLLSVKKYPGCGCVSKLRFWLQIRCLPGSDPLFLFLPRAFHIVLLASNGNRFVAFHSLLGRVWPLDA